MPYVSIKIGEIEIWQREHVEEAHDVIPLEFFIVVD